MTGIIHFLSWNTRAVKNSNKRQAILDSVKQYHPVICCIQKTHLLEDHKKLLSPQWAAQCYHAMYSTYARGVSILLHKSIAFTCISYKIDREGRYVCLHCTLYTTPCVIIGVCDKRGVDPTAVLSASA